MKDEEENKECKNGRIFFPSASFPVEVRSEPKRVVGLRLSWLELEKSAGGNVMGGSMGRKGQKYILGLDASCKDIIAAASLDNRLAVLHEAHSGNVHRSLPHPSVS
jgi:hypothetical protein